MPDTVAATTTLPPMFTPYAVRGLTLKNRVVLSPMCMYSAVDGTVNDFHLVHLGSRAQGGAGLILSEMTDVVPEGRISPGCAGMYKPEHVPAWKRVVDFVHGHTDAKIGVQLGHAGRKAATKVAWEGGGPLTGADAWPIVAPSPIPFTPESQTPREMDRRDMDRVRDAFVRAAGKADEAGFDIVELHFAHGYLLSTFVSPLSNKRSDGYGSSLGNRLRFPLEILKAVRAVWKKPLSMRISAVDWVEGGTTVEDAVEIGRRVKAEGLDILTVSSGNVINGARPTVSGLFQTPFSERVRREAGIPTMTVGNISSAADMNAIIAEGRADLCVMAKGHLYDPYFTRHAARQLGIEDPAWPRQYVAARMFKSGG
jgi:anthraniloyl-CoA monooxygenase